MQPGGVITPGSQPEQQSPAPQASVPASEPAPAPVAQTQPPVPEPEPQGPPIAQEQTEPQSEEANTAAQGAWQFHAEEDDYTQGQHAPAAVQWTASEYVAHDKNAGWYALVVLGSVVLAAIVYLIVRDFVSPVVVIILGIAFAAFGARPPQVLDYSIDKSGVHIGNKSYPYELFRTFSIIVEDATRSILLMPTKRYNLPITIYYDPKDEEKIVDALGSYLPHEDRVPSPIDNFMRKIRF